MKATRSPGNIKSFQNLEFKRTAITRFLLLMYPKSPKGVRGVSENVLAVFRGLEHCCGSLCRDHMPMVKVSMVTDRKY